MADLRRTLFANLALAAALGAAPVAPTAADLAQSGDLPGLRAMLAGDADPNAAQTDGTTALHWAVRHDNAAAVAMLLDAGADVAATNRYGVPALSLACVNGNAEILARLLEAGADPNAMLPGGESPLMTAARTGRLAAVKALLLAGADVNHAEERSGQTAVMWAAAEGHADVVKELVEYGADWRKRLASGFTAFLFGIRDGRIAVTRALLEAGANANQAFEPEKAARGRKPREGWSALLLAVQNQHYELASVLLDAGADPTADAPGYTVLHRLASVRKPGVGDNDPPPPGSGEIDGLGMARLLVAKGADVNARMTQHVNIGNTRLHRKGATPLFLAAHTADPDLVRVLLELGADASIPNSQNSNALMAAAGLGTRSPGEDPGTEDEILETLEILLEEGLDINAVDDKGETVMHSAAYKNLPGVVHYVDAHGADIGIWNQSNELGWTPLLIAEGYRYGNFKPSVVTIEAVSKVMRKHGAEVVLRGTGGEHMSEYK